MNYKTIKQCRVCSNKNFKKVVSLGDMALSGYFPKEYGEKVSSGPVDLVLCSNSKCNLVQLEQTFNLDEMYGNNYGYRSSLNSSMVEHLKKKVSQIKDLSLLEENDIILDIGSNDGTTLSQYEKNKFQLLGIDPSAQKFREYYRDDINCIVDFFSSKLFREKFGTSAKAKVVTSFAMFYDLEDPVQFANEVREILHEKGVWVLEMSYLPSMLKQNSYDTICHEHLEYYGLKQLDYIIRKAKLKILDYSLNSVNGGSISISVCHDDLEKEDNSKQIKKLIAEEEKTINNFSFTNFEKEIKESRTQLLQRLTELKKKNKKIYALGASTKGNIILQYCNLDTSLIEGIGEINQDKFNCFTPSTNIPIISEEEALKKGDIFLILPWHFTDTFLKNPKFKNKHLIFPLPFFKEFYP